MKLANKIFTTIASFRFSKNKLTPTVLNQLRVFGRFEYIYDPEIYSLNAFFTVFLERDHYSNVKRMLRNLKVNYFGEVIDGKVVFEGYQPKDLYDLVEFITINNLWATAADRKDPDGKRFYKVVEFVKASGNEKLVQTLNSYGFDEFRVAYGCVADTSHEKLMKLSPADAGMLGIGIIDAVYKSKRKLFGRFKFIAFIMYLMFFIFVLYSLFTYFN